MKRLCVFTLYDEKGASSRYRIMMYKDKLNEHFKVKLFHFWSNKYVSKYSFNKKKFIIQILVEYLFNMIKRLWQLYFVAPKCDVIFVQKGVIPGIKHTFIKHLAKLEKRIVFDVDDAIYLNSNDISDKIALQASIVICGNEELEIHYREVNPRCVIIPTVEDTRRFSPYWMDTFDNKIIGWIGSGVTLENLDIVVDAINILVERHPNVKLHIISNTAGNYLHRIQGAVFVNWQLDTYISEISKFTVGIMPLKDIPINHGKCGFKLIQCLNMKKPVVATEIGVNKAIVGNNGFLAGSTEEWIDALETLLFNRQVYERCVDTINDDFLPKYDYNQIAGRLVGIIEG